MRKRLAILFALAACLVGWFAAVAHADEVIEFMSHTYLSGGNNYFGPHFDNLSWVWGHSAGHAASCVGVSGHPEYQICRAENEGAKTEYIGFSGTSYLHNHSEYESYFYAWAEGYN